MSQTYPKNGAQLAPKIDLNQNKIDLGSLLGRSQYRTEKKFQTYSIWEPLEPWILSSLCSESSIFDFPEGPKKYQNWHSKVTPGASFWEPLEPNVAKNAFPKGFPKNDQKTSSKHDPTKIFCWGIGVPISLNFGTGPHLDPQFAN